MLFSDVQHRAYVSHITAGFVHKQSSPKMLQHLAERQRPLGKAARFTSMVAMHIYRSKNKSIMYGCLVNQSLSRIGSRETMVPRER